METAGALCPRISIRFAVMQPLLGYELRFLTGVFITLGVAGCALVLAVLLGLAGAVAKVSAGRVGRFCGFGVYDGGAGDSGVAVYFGGVL